MRDLSLFLLLATVSGVQAFEPPPQGAKEAVSAASGSHTTRGFVNPGSAVWDAVGKNWYVSNLAGGGSGGVGKAFISKLDAEGKLLEKEWVKGLNEPRGLCIVGRILYVADTNHVSVIDLQKGQFVQRIPVQGAKSLRDIASGPAGEIYVSELLQNVIYRLSLGARPEVFVSDKRLECPNGLMVDGDSLVVAAWGTITDTGFGTKVPGRLLKVDLRTKRLSNISPQRLGNLDGLVKVGAHYYVSDSRAGKLFMVGEDGAATLWKSGLQVASDLGLDRDRKIIAIPEMAAGTVTFAHAE